MESKEKLQLVVWMVTYNQERYIEQAIESVMMQKTNFDYKLLIGEDFSKDATRAICQELKKKYPQRIELFLNDKNYGATFNGRQMYQKCFDTGAKYVALLEGDDYWTDANKLQKQVDFLEKKEDCIFCFHNATIDAAPEKVYPKNVEKEIVNAKDFFQIATIPTASVVYRNFNYVPSDHSHGDFILYCELLSKGNAGYLNQTMAAYRMHGGGISAAYDSNVYLEKRIGELQIEMKIPSFSTSVKEEIGAILIMHILHYLNKNRGQLNGSQKKKYLGIALKCKNFYTQNLKTCFTLLRTLLS